MGKSSTISESDLKKKENEDLAVRALKAVASIQPDVKSFGKVVEGEEAKGFGGKSDLDRSAFGNGSFSEGFASGQTTSGKGKTLSQEEVHGLQTEDQDAEEKIRLAQLRDEFSEEVFAIAEDLSGNVREILLGTRSLSYSFDEEDTQLKGFSFAFRSLSSAEENDLKYQCRMNEWDINMTTQSMDLYYFEQVVVAMTSYCGKSLTGASLADRRKVISSIPFMLMRKIYRKYTDFLSALDLLAKGEGDLNLLKKFFAPRR